MNVRRIQAASRPLDATVTAPPSKSVTHRALVAAALADGPSTIRGPLDADDTRVTVEGLRGLGIPVETSAHAALVRGCGGRPPGGGDLWLGESGTSCRLLLALAALGIRPTRLDGTERLRRRPLGTLATALRRLGATVGPPPPSAELPRVAGGTIPQGGAVRVSARQSSQFASALMLIGARLVDGLEMTLEPPVVSLPYAELTEETLRAFGIGVERPAPLRWTVRPGGYRGRDLDVEGDHSTASYFLAAPAIAGGRVRVRGLLPSSRQADACFGKVLERLGCEVERGADWIEVRRTGPIPAFALSMGHAPDLVPTIAALALFAEGPCSVTGVGHLRLKESDRLELLAHDLRVLGREAHARDDALEVGEPARRIGPGTIVTGGDHRIAMAFAVAGLGAPGIALDDPDCVTKSDPGFWQRYEALIRGGTD